LRDPLPPVHDLHHQMQTTAAGLARRLLPFAGVLALAAPALAQPCPALQIRNPDGNYIVPGVKGDIPYSGALALDAYVQRGAGRRISVVVIHGGTWSSGSRSAHIGQLLETLTEGGFNWFAIDYRLGGLNAFEASIADVRAALGFVRCRARDLGVDPDRLVLLGEDSGAHLAAWLAAERPAGVIGAVLIGGFYDLSAAPAMAKSADSSLLSRASPIARVPTGMPPLLVVHGGADSESPLDQAQRYCRAVEDSKGRCRLLEVQGASHRSENWWPNQWGYKRDMVAWLATLSSDAPRSHQPYRSPQLLKQIVYSETPRLTLDAFVAQSGKPRPAVIVVHGGGWEAGDRVTYVTPLFEPLARAGLAWFSIDYRLTPAATNEEQLEDVRRAIRFVRAGHARFNIDPARIVLAGESASGQIVAQIAAADPSLGGVISFYGVYDLPSMVTDASPRSLLVRLFHRKSLDDDARALLRRYSPLYAAHKDMPPLLLINGTGERLWAQAEAFAKRLTEVGARHELIVLEGAPHGLENWEGRADWTSYKTRMVEWIRNR